MSAIEAMSIPAPAAGPLIAAMYGFSSWISARGIGCTRFRRLCRRSAIVTLMPESSPPAAALGARRPPSYTQHSGLSTQDSFHAQFHQARLASRRLHEGDREGEGARQSLRDDRQNAARADLHPG